LNVTFVLALFVFGKVGLNMTGLGVNDTGSPSPVTGSVSNVFPFASAGNVVLTVPFALPDTVGEKITLNEQDPPEGTTVEVVVLQTLPVSPVVLTLKPVLATGLVIVSEEAPLFVNVTLVAKELVFIVWGGKFMKLGVNVSNGPLQLVQPVPVIKNRSSAELSFMAEKLSVYSKVLNNLSRQM
jgi:hypothetical protein